MLLGHSGNRCDVRADLPKLDCIDANLKSGDCSWSKTNPTPVLQRLQTPSKSKTNGGIFGEIPLIWLIVRARNQSAPIHRPKVPSNPSRAPQHGNPQMSSP